MTPRRIHNLPPNLTLDQVNGRYRYRNPITGKRYWLGKDRVAACQRAKKLNKEVQAVIDARQAQAGIHTITGMISQYIANVVPGKPWDDATRKNHLFALALYQREFGTALFGTLDRVRLAEWIKARAKTGEAFNKHRARWIDIYRYAIARGVTDYNEAEAIMKASVSKKIAANRKTRKRMELKAFKTIHKAAPHWMQIAMELSLVTCQARAEIVSMKRSDKRDGWLYVIRDKTSGDSDMAFIRIAMTPTLEDIWRRAWSDGLSSRYVVHRKPLREKQEGTPDFGRIEPAYLTREFRKVRDETGVYAHLEPSQRPTFHEIRSLGGRLYVKEYGWTKEQVRALMAHGDTKTTDIYLTAPEALTDEHFRRVEATMDLKELGVDKTA